MKEQLPSKGTKPVTGTTMLNFVHWLDMYYPSIRSLQSLEDRALLQLIEKFENSRADLEQYSLKSWKESLDRLSKGDNSYKEAYRALNRRR